MHSAILLAKMSSGNEPISRQKWQAFSATIAVLKHNPALVRLGENTWLANFRQSPSALARLVVACEQHGVDYGILPLADAPQWLPDGFDPRPTEDRNEEDSWRGSEDDIE